MGGKAWNLQSPPKNLDMFSLTTLACVSRHQTVLYRFLHFLLSLFTLGMGQVHTVKIIFEHFRLRLFQDQEKKIFFLRKVIDSSLHYSTYKVLQGTLSCKLEILKHDVLKNLQCLK